MSFREIMRKYSANKRLFAKVSLPDRINMESACEGDPRHNPGAGSVWNRDLHLLLFQVRQVHFVEDQHVGLKPQGFLKQRVAA